MKYSQAYIVAALAPGAYAQGWKFFVGGYSGEQVNDMHTDFNDGGLWMGTVLDCSQVSTGSAFKLKTGKDGDLVYDWCNINFAFDDKHCSGNQLYLADPNGSGNCGGVCDTETKCADGKHFANVYDASNGNSQVGTCEYYGGWKKNCASNGSQEYNTLIQCTVTGC